MLRDQNQGCGCRKRGRDDSRPAGGNIRSASRGQKEEEQKRMAKETLRGRAFHISLSQKSEGNDYGSRFQGEGG